MASSDRPFVVGIAGAAGAGKTTLCDALAKLLVDASVLHVDDYQRVTAQPLAQIGQWAQRGADFDELHIPVLAEHLAKLRRGEMVIDPLSLREVRPARFIVFETHFGRAHRASGEHIDFLVWLDTPLDIALARNMRDLLAQVLQDPSAPAGRDRFDWLDSYVRAYLEQVRPMLAMQRERVAAGADLVLDGAEPAPSLAERVREAIALNR